MRQTILIRFALFISIVFLFSSKVLAQATTTDTTNHKRDKLFELSFGSSLLFISNSDLLNIRSKSAITLPTSSVLFFIELRPLKKTRIPLFFNLPTETKQFLVNNQLVNEKASLSFGAGLQFKLFQFKIDDKSSLEMEIGPLMSFGFDRDNQLWAAPLIASRLRLMRSENFVMYIGGSYAAGVNALGLLYGTGTIF